MTAPKTAPLTAQNLTKRFRNGGAEVTVLDNVSLTVERGEFVAVMGPSGSGKSTLLYCLSGIDAFDEGRVLLEGQSIGELSEDDRATLRSQRLGFVFQEPNLLESLNVLDNVMLAAALEGATPASELEGRARELLRSTGLGGLEERAVHELSGGQRQRVSLCRALVNEPAMLFGDEPTGALNASASAEIVELLTRFNQSGTTIVVVTHDPRVAARAQRVVFLADGRVVNEVAAPAGEPLREELVLEAMGQLGV